LKTEDLVTMLATGAVAVEPNVAARRYGIALVCGAFGSALLMALLLGVRPDLAQAVLLPMFWVKFAYVACLALTGVFVVMVLSRPGARLGATPAALAAPVIAMWMLAAFVLTSADTTQRRQLLFGGTWTTCPFLIAMLSVPVFVAVMLAMKGLAPTRLRLAGAAAGLVSGSLGALVYTLHCPEMAAPFLSIWYLLGVLIPTGIGALLGPRLLRW
jgi:hypothetical protein